MGGSLTPVGGVFSDRGGACEEVGDHLLQSQATEKRGLENFQPSPEMLM